VIAKDSGDGKAKPPAWYGSAEYVRTQHGRGYRTPLPSAMKRPTFAHRGALSPRAKPKSGNRPPRQAPKTNTAAKPGKEASRPRALTAECPDRATWKQTDEGHGLAGHSYALHGRSNASAAAKAKSAMLYDMHRTSVRRIIHPTTKGGFVFNTQETPQNSKVTIIIVIVAVMVVLISATWYLTS
jgi:hypothetical protein